LKAAGKEKNAVSNSEKDSNLGVKRTRNNEDTEVRPAVASGPREVKKKNLNQKSAKTDPRLGNLRHKGLGRIKRAKKRNKHHLKL